MSCKGGSGATFLATNLGYALAALENKRVVLIDLNLQFGDASLFVSDSKPLATLADVAQQIHRLDHSLLASSMLNVTPNFALLAAPEDPVHADDVKPEHIDALLTLARQHYDFILLDVGRGLDAVSVRALDQSDMIFPVLQTTLPYVRDGKRLLDVFRSLDYHRDKIFLIVNRHEKSSEIKLRDLETAYGSAVFMTIPNHYEAAAASVNQGVPVLKLARTVRYQNRCRTSPGLSLARRASPAGLVCADIQERLTHRIDRYARYWRSRHGSRNYDTEGPAGKRQCQQRRAGRRPKPGGADNRAYQQLKHSIHQTLLDRIDLESLQRLTQDQIREELRILVERVLEEDVVVINDIERKNLTRDIQNEMLGFGPLETLLADPTVSDILVNTYKQVYVERHGRLELTDVTLHRRRAPDEDHRQDRLAGGPPHRRIVPDGGRAPAGRLARQRDHSAAGDRRPDPVDPPLRPPSRCALADLVAYDSMTADMAEILQGWARRKSTS